MKITITIFIFMSLGDHIISYHISYIIIYYDNYCNILLQNERFISLVAKYFDLKSSKGKKDEMQSLLDGIHLLLPIESTNIL